MAFQFPKGFDKHLLLSQVNYIGVEWMLGYGNTPKILIGLNPNISGSSFFQGPRNEDGVIIRSAVKWRKSSGHYYYAPHPNGFVHYTWHNKYNQTGFAGSLFGYLVDGQEEVVKGPWSSRATALNMCEEVKADPLGLEVTDVILYDHQGSRRSCGMATAIKTDALLTLCRHFQPDFHIVRRRHEKGLEQAPWTASVSCDLGAKPGDKVFAPEVDILWKQGEE